MPTRYFLSPLLLCALCAQFSLGGVAVNGGSLHMRGGSVKSDDFAVAAGGTLEGNGTIESPSSRLAGTTAPGGEYAAETGSLQFDGNVELDGTYECTVNGHDDLDLVAATGAISGAAEIAVDKEPAAIPLQREILVGDVDSDFVSFALPPSQAADFRLESVSPGSLELTDVVGDTDADGLPDYWEFDYYSDRVLADPNLDDDDDNSINRYEFGAGTDPWDDQSVFSIIRTETANGCKLLWNSVSGKLYAVQAAAALEGAFDQILATNLAATSPVTSWTNSDPSAFGPFYRVVVER